MPADGLAVGPRKRDFRQRAHANPLADQSFDVPARPSAVGWEGKFTPEAWRAGGGRIAFADVGCGFGGLLMALSAKFPDKLCVGMELRDKVSAYVQERIAGHREESGGQRAGNACCMRVNAMKALPNYFERGTLEKLFFLYPDPHFKRTNHRRRIVSTQLLAEYAYCLGVGALVYTVTDVEELHLWMAEHLEAHALFERVSEEELAADPVAPLLKTSSEEGQKVARNSGSHFIAVFRRIEDPRLNREGAPAKRQRA
uniref:tRNA (guanine-N(7)-)-methyltransferase n=1 Tax=Prasinoderma coloniale TaxID=156133 RepID=A0A7R9Y181_9VIRI|eukprot:PRCOL_00003713-RA